MKLITANKLNRFCQGIKAIFVPKARVLITAEQVKANTNAENVASAVVTKELFNNLNAKMPGDVKLITEGSGANTKYYIQLGADAASKKPLGSSGVYIKRLSGRSGEAPAITVDITNYSSLKIGKFVWGGAYGGIEIKKGDEKTTLLFEYSGGKTTTLTNLSYDITGYDTLTMQPGAGSGYTSYAEDIIIT